jgi:polynucleotide 5'-hydroxyl-kinase GRC3/NOL9
MAYLYRTVMQAIGVVRSSLRHSCQPVKSRRRWAHETIRETRMELDIPAAWEWSAAQIARQRWRKILVLGDVDCGKSTYCRFLSDYLMATGVRVAIVDADVGQKAIGPPATITLGYPQETPTSAVIEPVAWYFVGTVTPVGHLLPMVLGTRQLVEAARAPYVLINTTGFIHGVGQVLKSYKIEAIQPDVVVTIEHNHELQALRNAYRNYRILRIRPSPQARIKTPEQRRAAREQAFGRYFQSAPEVGLSCRRLIFQRATVPTGLAPNLLCGVADRRNQGLGIARLTAIDWQQDHLALHTPVPTERIRILQAGSLYLAAAGYELGRS